MIQLRDYQQRAIDTARRVVAAGARAPILVAPTGSGKTIIGVDLATRALERGRRVLWLAHRRELLDQTAAALARAGADRVSILRADDDRRDESAPITVASIQTLIARDARPPADVVVFDEAHHYVADQWGAVASAYADAIRIGLTATPERGDGSPLGDLFDALVVVAHYSELVRAGHLVQCNVVAPTRKLDSKELAAAPWEAYAQHGSGRPAVIFTGTVHEAKTVSERMDSCACIHGSMRDDERAAALAAFAAGSRNALANCFVLTEGWDAPRAEVCVLARGCSHASTYIQIAGRILRPAPGKTSALMIDLVGAVHDHGLPTDDREYSLTGEAIRRSASAQSLWQCTACGCVRPSRPFDDLCPGCGEEIPPPEAHEIKHTTLVAHIAWTCKCGEQYQTMPLACAICGRFSPRFNRVSSESQESREAYYDRMIALGRERGYKPGWAAYKYKTKYGQWPPRRAA